MAVQLNLADNSVNTIFGTAYHQLNPKQKHAVDSIDGPIMVVAGPGTGKTQVLALRIANILITTDTPPSSILALTFTESGAQAMNKPNPYPIYKEYKSSPTSSNPHHGKFSNQRVNPSYILKV